MLGKIEGKRKGAAEDHWVDSITDSMDMNLSKFWETVKDKGAWCAAVHGVTKMLDRTEQLGNNNRRIMLSSYHLQLAC